MLFNNIRLEYLCLSLVSFKMVQLNLSDKKYLRQAFQNKASFTFGPVLQVLTSVI